jgi:hypothetical protein
MAYEPQSSGPFLKGLVSSNQPLAQPKGSFPRGSNLVLMERGALTPCDGSGIINWFSAAVQSNRGRMMDEFLYEPTGVNPYYLVLAQALDEHLGAPHVNSATASTGGSLMSGQQYFYEVTALDGVGGETLVSNEVSATPAGGNLSVTLVWNRVPNAFGYNVYRGTTSGTEVLLYGSTTAVLPVLQPTTATVTFIDDGTTSNVSAFTISTITITLIFGSPQHRLATMVLTTPVLAQNTQSVVVTGVSPSTFNGTPFVTQATGVSSTNVTLLGIIPTWATLAHGAVGTGGTATFSSAPPLSDTTQQTVLYEMPSGLTPVSYTNSNIVAFFPASLGALGQVPTGGTGGQGTTGQGISGQGNSTPSGGVIGLVGALPQMKQFTNRVCMAMGNGFPIQVFWDSTGSTVNSAPTGAITSVSVTGDEVTVTTSATLSATNPFAAGFMPVGSNVVISAASDSTYNGTFVVIAVTTHTFTVRNTSASGGASTGTWTISTTPIVTNSSFTPAYPAWVASPAYAVGDIIVPATQPGNAIYVTCTQAGTSGGSEPGWNSPQPVTGEQFKDNNIIWTVSGLLNSTAPPPPGAGHIEIYAGSLWALNTWPVNTTNGLDGPTALRMANTNNPFGWNPVNQAFLDKDDGAEGMGLGKFTITAQGIPPEGSLIAFKYRVPYQIIGVFGANNFQIQPVSSDMGCLAPRTIQFVAGYGLTRYTHLGFSVFDGWRDQVISEQIRPYLFPVNDFDEEDIVVADANYMPLAWGSQTSNPPMYAVAIPIGNSGGKLTRMMLYDLILKCWAAPVDLPFPIGSMAQVQPVTSNPLTILGGFNDGVLQRWQAGDNQWYTGGGVSQVPVVWSLRTITVASQASSQRIWARKLMVRGTNTGSSGIITVQPRRSTVPQAAVNYTIPGNGDFDLFADVGLTGVRFDAIISGNVDITIDGIDWAVEPRPFGVPVQAV